MRQPTTFVPLSLLLACCAHGPQKGPADMIATRSIFIAANARLVDVEVSADGQPQRRGVDTSFAKTQSFALDVDLLTPGYLYFVHTQADGKSQRLFPAAAQTEQKMTGRARIPSPSGWLQLAGFATGDRLCVMLSEEQMDPEAQSCPKPSREDPDKATPDSSKETSKKEDGKKNASKKDDSKAPGKDSKHPPLPPA